MTVIPRPASTLMLLRQEGGKAAPQVLMIVRNAKTAFAGGALVFPGGSVDQADHDLAGDIAGTYSHLTVEELTLRIAAIRETFEESGILLACADDGAPVAPETVANLVTACRGSDGPDFRAAIRAGGLLPAVDSLIPFARWITPPIRPKRFDTHFFIAAAPSGQSLAHDGSEAVDSIWIEPKAAIDGTSQGRFKLVFATRMNLNRIGASASMQDAMAQARATPLVTIMPEYIETPEGASIRIPAEAGYGGELFPAADPPSM
jgi:8-oxo-dGTP pyrophosphatase MutT (NUDIX family)